MTDSGTDPADGHQTNLYLIVAFLVAALALAWVAYRADDTTTSEMPAAVSRTVTHWQVEIAPEFFTELHTDTAEVCTLFLPDDRVYFMGTVAELRRRVEAGNLKIAQEPMADFLFSQQVRAEAEQEKDDESESATHE